MIFFGMVDLKEEKADVINRQQLRKRNRQVSRNDLRRSVTLHMASEVEQSSASEMSINISKSIEELKKA